jgi:hypothetical protein
MSPCSKTEFYCALPFMAIFLGTNSKVAEFLPLGENSSIRYYESDMVVPPPFTALEWDVDSSDQFKGLSYDKLPGMTWLSRFGWPMWRSLWESLNDREQRLKDASSENKLHHLPKNHFLDLLMADKDFENYTRPQEGSEDFLLTCSAILGVQFWTSISVLRVVLWTW